MRPADPNEPRVARVVAGARRSGLDIEPVTFENETRTAEQAANEIGCDVAAIVKSLVFQADGRALLFLVSGANRLDPRRAAAAAEVGAVAKADAALTKSATGFSIGGVPPFGHLNELPVIVDRDLLRFDEVWAAAGRPDTVFPIDPNELARAAGGRVAALKAE
ncbi:MAG: YbaK/EbsC family protein [Actinobacteria bacterium]|nr:YbaK/EbsC family protein [Actinomycetota bacterium]